VPNLRAPRSKKLRPNKIENGSGNVIKDGSKSIQRGKKNSPVKSELKEYATSVVAITGTGSSDPIRSAILDAMMWKNGCPERK